MSNDKYKDELLCLEYKEKLITYIIILKVLSSFKKGKYN